MHVSVYILGKLVLLKTTVLSNLVKKDISGNLVKLNIVKSTWYLKPDAL